MVKHTVFENLNKIQILITSEDKTGLLLCLQPNKNNLRIMKVNLKSFNKIRITYKHLKRSRRKMIIK